MCWALTTNDGCVMMQTVVTAQGASSRSQGTASVFPEGTGWIRVLFKVGYGRAFYAKQMGRKIFSKISELGERWKNGLMRRGCEGDVRVPITPVCLECTWE